MSTPDEVGALMPYASGKGDNGATWELHQRDAREVLRQLPTGSVNTTVTSPAYYWQRDYEVEGQFGLEPAIDGYVENLRETLAELQRVLAEHGTLSLNLGGT